MVPKPQGENQDKTRPEMSRPQYYRTYAISEDMEIVISGMAGKFPKSDNVAEFANNLYNEVDMLSETKPEWLQVHPLVPKRIGHISDVQKFDATFFGVHHGQVYTMDPQCRIILEQAYMAIMDAGVNPNSIRGSKIGVYIASCFSESEKAVLNNPASVGSSGIIGCSRAMYANRISYTLGLTGPSLYVDTACSSSMYALDAAYTALRNHEIDGAVVGGAHLIQHPFASIHFTRLGVLSSTSNCRPFDQAANGYVRSEGVGAIFLQRRGDARRIYATLVHSKTNCDGYKPEGITYPSSRMQEKLLREFYEDVQISVDDIGYMEAHSTGTIVGDPEECTAIDNALCKKRKEPLLVGSVKGNIGHTEPSSGVCSIVKVMIALQNNKIPPNINFSTAKKEITGLVEGRMKVIQEVTCLKKPYVGINSFGFGGANAHILVKQFDKVKTKSADSENLPRVLLWSGRTMEAVEAAFQKVERLPLDPEYIALMHSAQAGGVPGMVIRGYNLLKINGTEPTTSVGKGIQHYDGMKRPMVWVFSGMGSQWTGMGAELMRIPLFRESIQRCHDVLKSTGLDLIKILTVQDKNMYDNITHSFIGIAAIQIALVDILKSFGLEPDFIIGHSTGELGCAYADGCFTLKEMMLAAYYRGKVSRDNKTIKGSMAAIGLSYNAIRSMLPEAIEVACHNSSDSCTISGPAEDVEKFVNEMKERNIFAREVSCSNIAYHTRHIAHLGGEFFKYLKQIVPTPKKRSQKWLSTSVPYKQWSRPESLYSSAEYHTNNLLSSVLFEETAALLPKNSLIIEIAPHSLLQSILRSAIPQGVYIGLTQRNNKDNHTFFLGALGKLYLNGIEIPIDNLYPKIEWPVARGTETISDIVKLDHRDDWPVYNYQTINPKKTGEKLIRVNMQVEKYLVGHNLDGKILLPATYYIESIWNTFVVMRYGTGVTEKAIEIENLKFIRATPLTMDSKVELTLMIHFGTGNFEIVDGDSLVVTGTVREITDATKPREVEVKPFDTQHGNEFKMTTKDVYKELKLRGYYYSDEFRGIESIRGDGQVGRIRWNSNWVTFVDCMLQMHILRVDSRELCLPTKIRKIRIFGAHHAEQVADKTFVDVYADAEEDRLVGGGVELIGLEASPVQRRKPPGLPVLERYQFIPNNASVALNAADVGRMFIQLVIENDALTNLKIIEVISKSGAKPTIEYFQNAIEDLPLLTGEFSIISSSTYEDLPASVVVGKGKFNESSVCNLVIDQAGGETLSVAKSMTGTGYVVVILTPGSSVSVPPQFVVISTSICSDDGSKFLLLRRKPLQRATRLEWLHVSSNDTEFSWLKQAQQILSSSDLLLIAEKDRHNGVLGLTNCLRKEYSKTEVRCLLIDDPNAPAFDPKNPLYSNQLALGMAVNIYRNGQWGTYRHLQLVPHLEEAPHSGHVYGNIMHRGDMSSLRWMQGRLSPESAKIKVVYSSLNFKDIMLATGRISSDARGRLSQECVLGMEFAGIDRRTGKRIMGMMPAAAVSNYIEHPSKITMEVPQKWTLREAATIPVVYATVYYAFFIRSDIRKGKSILIHAGTGGIGLSAIRTALAYGLEVFTTVSTVEKRNYLLRNFSSLKASHIGNSRDTSFETMIRRETNGRGVDFVLNSLAEEKLLASIRCLAIDGVFLEIGKFDMSNDNLIGLAPFLKQLSFVAVLLDLVMQQDDPVVIKNLCDLLEKDIANGIIQPLPTTVFPAKEIEQAFRFLASGKHIGKVLIQVRETEESEATLPIQVLPVRYFSPDLVYIVPGGLGGFGLELVDWMVLRGARKIVLSSSRGITNGYQSYRIRLWKSYGCEIRISTANIGLKHGCEALIRVAMILGPVGGIFNLAVVLKDGMFENQTVQLYKESMLPKAVATQYLDELSRELCPNLEHFVIFSSVSCGRGNAGQTNYGMANSVMERIIEDRISAGLPGKAIEWGAVGEVGLVAILAEDKIDLEIGGTLQQRISSCLRELDVLLSCPDALTASMVVAEKRMGVAGAENILEKVMNILSIRDLKTVSYGSTLSELGMDSLMAVDIKQTLEREFDLFLSAQELRTLTLQKLQEYSDEHENSEGKAMPADIESAEQRITMLRSLGDETNFDKVLIPINEGKKGSPPIFFLTGIEGSSGQIWMDIGKNLNSPAYVIQMHKTAHMKDYDEIATFTYEHIKAVLKPTENYHIVGFSYGALTAIKAARILEEKGHAGKLVLIDGSPEVVDLMFKAWVQAVGKENVESLLLSTVVCMVLPNESEDTCRQEFLQATTMEQKQNTLLKYAQKQKAFSESYFEAQCVALMQRCRLAIDIDTSSFHRIAGPIFLVKPRTPLVANISADNGLSVLTTNEVHIRNLDGNHFTVLENPELPKLINEIMISN